MPGKSAHVKNDKQYGDSRQGGTTAQKKAAGHKGGLATARKRSSTPRLEGGA